MPEEYGNSIDPHRPYQSNFVFYNLQPRFLTERGFLTIGPSSPVLPSDFERHCAAHHQRRDRKFQA